MLKPLIYKYHSIQNFQRFVNYIFLEVVFNPIIFRNNVLFDETLVINKYRSFIGVNSEYILNPLEIIFTICKSLEQKDIKTLRRAVHHNNKIEALCLGQVEPVNYREICNIDETLAIELQKFFGKLYKYVIDLQVVYSVYGKKSDFYKFIIGAETVCSCCGVGTILNAFQHPVGALDHYFPIKHYPFSSVNFKNLVPICDICNSKYKTQKDTLYSRKGRLKNGVKKYTTTKFRSFYPYSENYNLIEVSVNITNDNLQNLTMDDIEIDYSLAGFTAEIANWERLFKVSEVHKANLLSNESRIFINQQFDIMNMLNMSFADYYNLINNNLFYNKNFIRLPYLREFNRITSL